MTKANWKYDVLCHLNLTHTAGLEDKDFTLAPSRACQLILKRHNLLFRPRPNGALIIAEKRIQADGSTTPLWRINEPTALTFLLQLRNPGLLARTKPFDQSTLPAFIGRRRIIYLDNLNAARAIDGDADLDLHGNTFVELAANGVVSEQDLASLVPNEFSYVADGSTVTSATALLLRPGAETEVTLNETTTTWPADRFPFAAAWPKMMLSLPTGGFRFTLGGTGSTSEILFAGTDVLNMSTFGIIQLYKDATIDYSKPIRYDIHFEKP